MEKDYTDIKAITPMMRFSDKLSKVRLEFDRKHKPFDEQCARLDFVDKVEKAEKESERMNGYVNMEDIKVEVDEEFLNQYGDEDRFVFIEEQPHLQDKVIEGTRTQVLTGYHRNYRCKARGHGISIFIPIEDYNKEKKEVKNEAKNK